MANIALVATASSNGVRIDYNPEQNANAMPVLQWPASGSGTHVREFSYVPIVSPINVAAGSGLTTGKPIFG